MVGAAAVAIVSAGFPPEARADDRNPAGASSGSASSGRAASSGTGSTASAESGGSQARMTPSAVGKMSPAEQMQMMDKDNKGYVTKEEFLKFQERLWNNVPKSKADRVTEQEWLNQIHSGP